MSSPLFPDPPARLHFIGLRGVGMTALAQILQGHGYTITGSDSPDSFAFAPVLEQLGIHCAIGFDAAHVTHDVAGIIYSTAYPAEHPERRAAAAQGIPSWSYPEAVGFIMSLYEQSIAVAGSHGKTTTSALLSRMLEEGLVDPTALIGSTVVDWGRNARIGKSEWFVLEADEYQDKFQYYQPRHAIITNIDFDHPDFFKDVESYEQTFMRFAQRLPANGTLAVWGEEPSLAKLKAVALAPIITYGSGTANDWQLQDVQISSEQTTFSVVKQGETFGTFTINFPGEHYALNALGAMVLADRAGVRVEAIARALKYYRGTARRLEAKGEYRGAILLDDYAHHPTEIAATLRGLRARYPEARIWCVFQSHTYTRTAAFLEDFGKSLAIADEIVVLPTYGSAREAEGPVTTEALVDAVQQTSGGKAREVVDHAAAAKLLASELSAGDVMVTMGAGDIWQVHNLLQA